VANSILAAIWLLWKTLPPNTLPDSGWENLVREADLLTRRTDDDDPDDGDAEPPSAQLPPTAKRTAEDIPHPSQKRARTSELESDAEDTRSTTSRLEDGGPDEREQPAAMVRTNNNRAAERKREKLLESRALDRKRSLGLVEPLPKAARVEHAAYASISPKDEPTIAWIVKQPDGKVGRDGLPLYETMKTPYATATAMHRKAAVLGNQTARYHAASFLKVWRSVGTPFPSRMEPFAAARPVGPLPGAMATDEPDRAFCHAWGVVDFYEGSLAAVHIQYRWAMAFLARAYADKIARLEQEDEFAARGTSRSRMGRGNLRTEAKKALLLLIYSNHTAKERDIFRKRLQRATRWYEAACVLGWGSLCLMPYDEITLTWVEQTLRVAEWHTWLDLVKKVNPDAYAASMALDDWLGSESIAGGPINEKEVLRIESAVPTTIYEVEEVPDSEGEEEDELAPTQSEPSSGVIQCWRGLALTELFQPQSCRNHSSIVSAA
jgi:hypothetical protein